MEISPIIIDKSTIINNFEWFNGPAKDLIEYNGLLDVFNYVQEELKNIPEMNINIDSFDYQIKKPSKPIEKLYDMFWKLNEQKENKYTYLPNLIGIYLIIQNQNQK